MVKRWLISLLLGCTLAALAQAPFLMHRRNEARPKGGSGGAPTYLVQESFDPAGYDLSWTEVGTVNPNDTTSPAPLEGTQSWSSSAIAGESWTSFSPQSTVHVYAMGNFAVLDNIVEVFEIRDDAPLYVTRVRLLSDGSMRIVNFATSATTAAGLVTAGNTFHMWLDYTKGTGADSTSAIYISSTATKPGSPSASITGAGSTTDAYRVAVMSYNGGRYIWDKVRVDDAEIGSNPP